MTNIATRLASLEKRLNPDNSIRVYVVRTDPETGQEYDYFTGELIPPPAPGDVVIRVGFDLGEV